MNGVAEFLSGSVMLGSWVIGIYFFRFWSKSKDRLFLFFGVSFWIMALERLLIVLFGDAQTEEHAYFYLLRLCAFVLILVAIADKNRALK